MNLSEFKAWFEGYTENMDGPPNKRQWNRIQQRVDEISESSTSYPIFIDRYVRPNYPFWTGPWFTCTVGGATYGTVTSGDALISTNDYQLCFNSQDAFRELGRLEASSVVGY